MRQPSSESPCQSVHASLAERANFPLQDGLHYKPVIQEAVERVLDSGQTILAAGVRGFEADFAAWLGGGLTADHCIGVGHGTDALELALRCAGVQSGDDVIVPSFTAYATVAALLRLGAHPLFADTEPLRPVIAVSEVERILNSRRYDHQRIKAMIAVHLYGDACDLSALRQLCSEHGMALIEDCAQAMGTTYQGSCVGTWGDYAAFSFYPTKNLAALGDGGMLVVGAHASAEQLEAARRLRGYGWSASKEAVQCGVNSRLDEVQAWILRGKLKDLADKLEARRALASAYQLKLKSLAEAGAIQLPSMASSSPNSSPNSSQHSFHLYVIQVDAGLRDEIVGQGGLVGIPYGVHYPLACHQHAHIRDLYGNADGCLPHGERLATRVLSLPLNPYLSDSDLSEVCQHLHDCLGRGA